MEEKLLEIKRFIRKGIYLFQICNGHFSVSLVFNYLTFICFSGFFRLKNRARGVTPDYEVRGVTNAMRKKKFLDDVKIK